MKSRAGVSTLGCLFTLLVVAAVVYFGIQAGETYFRYLEFKDALKQEVKFRGHLPNDQIRGHLRLIADSLGLPESAGNVAIARDGKIITIEAYYSEFIDLPGFKREVFFEPRASGPY